MQYPKPVMRINELIKLGFAKEYLMSAYRDKNQTFAWKINITKSNSPILFDTEGLEEYRIQKIKQEKDARKRLTMVM